MKKSSKTTSAAQKVSATAKSTPAPAKKSAPTTSKAPAAIAPAARKAPVATPAAVVKKTPPKAFLTMISARIDVGYGNTLYVRGEGPGLSWDKGIVMACTGDDRWTLALGESARPVVFKFLLNDQVWSSGEDYTAKPGVAVAFTPVF